MKEKANLRGQEERKESEMKQEGKVGKTKTHSRSKYAYCLVR